MDEKFDLFKEGGNNSTLWTRKEGKALREKLFNYLDSLQTKDALVIDISSIKAFDFSFANEFFGKLILEFPTDHSDTLIFIEGLSEHTREDLNQALESLDLMMVERVDGKLALIGKVSEIHKKTYEAIIEEEQPLASIQLKDKLGIKLTAANERLSKLVDKRVIRRTVSVSEAGREQFLYAAR